MRMLIAFILFWGTCLAVPDLAACPEESLSVAGSASSSQTVLERDVSPAKEWVSYFENIGKIRIDLSLDGFKVRPIFIQGNTAFSIIYQFYIGEDGHPTHIYPILGDKRLDDADAARACLAKWTLSGLLPNKKYLLILNWEHIKGYTLLTLSGDQMSFSISLGR